ncbi:hypothetical protein N8482_01245 [Chitinophagales bacterium]|nr:hypothetical protein [Chitinophagales bacterium]
MLQSFRTNFNARFSPARYDHLLKLIHAEYGHSPKFRVAETPVVIPSHLKEQLISACSSIADQINTPDFKEKTEGAFIAPNMKIPGENDFSHFLQIDFAICKDEQGELSPQVIEMQGFPSLYFFQELLARSYRSAFDIPSEYSAHLGGISDTDYLRLLSDLILDGKKPENVVVLEVEPTKQTTYIDLLGCQKQLGTPILCVTDVIKKDNKLFYKDDKGIEKPIYRIFNRVIFDELDQRSDLTMDFSFQDELDVEWVGHPSWFFRISKYTLPLLDHPNVPPSRFLHELEKYPTELDNYVLKPLFSFAGAGVDLHPTKEKLDAIKDRNNYILQRKMNYVPIVETSTDPAKCEIRMLMLWDKEKKKHRIVNNLVRLSKGEMIGVRYNKDKDWVGGTVGYFE